MCIFFPAVRFHGWDPAPLDPSPWFSYSFIWICFPPLLVVLSVNWVLPWGYQWGDWYFILSCQLPSNFLPVLIYFFIRSGRWSYWDVNFGFIVAVFPSFCSELSRRASHFPTLVDWVPATSRLFFSINFLYFSHIGLSLFHTIFLSLACFCLCLLCCLPCCWWSPRVLLWSSCTPLFTLTIR